MTVPYSGGSACAVCGAWVVNGIPHTCSIQYPYQPPPVYSYQAVEMQIAAALERIVSLLERLVETQESRDAL